MNRRNRQHPGQRPVGFDPTLAQRQPDSKHLVEDPRGGMSWTIRDRANNIEAQGITGDYDVESILKELNSLRSGQDGML